MLATKRFRVAAGLFAAVVVLGAGASVAASSQSTTATAGCGPSGLVVWLDTQGQGTLGHLNYFMQFTNLSGRACTLKGYPGVSAVDLRGRQLGAAAARDTATPSRSIRLAPGGTAKALVRITQTGVFSRSVCGPVTAAGFRVFAPNARSAKIVPFPFSACSRNTVTYLTIRAVTR